MDDEEKTEMGEKRHYYYMRFISHFLSNHVFDKVFMGHPLNAMYFGPFTLILAHHAMYTQYILGHNVHTMHSGTPCTHKLVGTP